MATLINNYRYTNADDRRNDTLVYVLMIIMFSLLALMWVLQWSSDKKARELKSGNYRQVRNENVKMKLVLMDCKHFA